jgi:hypothetical protein
MPRESRHSNQMGERNGDAHSFAWWLPFSVAGHTVEGNGTGTHIVLHGGCHSRSQAIPLSIVKVSGRGVEVMNGIAGENRDSETCSQAPTPTVTTRLATPLSFVSVTISLGTNISVSGYHP